MPQLHAFFEGSIGREVIIEVKGDAASPLPCYYYDPSLHLPLYLVTDTPVSLGKYSCIGGEKMAACRRTHFGIV